MKILFFICLLINASAYLQFNCGADHFHHVVPKEVKIEGKDRFLQYSASYSPIRIYFDFTDLNNKKDSLEFGFKNKIEEVLTSISKHLSYLISLKSFTNNIQIKDCSGLEIDIPEPINTDGVDTDLILFVIIDVPDSTRSTTEAYAYTCSVDSETGRPIAGVVAINTNLVKFEKKNSFDYHYNLLMHEIFHVLGFNNSLFPYFYDPINGKRKNLDETKKVNVNVNGVKTSLIVSPKVKEVAAKYFDCNTIDGVELESQGGNASASSHWESRIMLGDLMISQSYSDIALSEITLALLEDSGWYKVSYLTGGLMKFGLHAGCDFLNKKCVDNNVTLFSDFFCKTEDSLRCISGSYRGFCQLGNFDNIPIEYRYFDDTTKGGPFTFADYCPVINGFTLEKTSYYSGSCKSGTKEKVEEEYDLYIGDDAGCFESSLYEFKNDGNMYNRPLNVYCYKFMCDHENTSVIVTLKENSYNCPGGGGKLQLNNFSGYIICPKYNLFCTSTTYCSSLFDCIDKKSKRREPVSSYKTSENWDLIGKDKKAFPISYNPNTTKTEETKKDVTSENSSTNTQTSEVKVVIDKNETKNTSNTSSDSSKQYLNENFIFSFIVLIVMVIF